MPAPPTAPLYGRHIAIARLTHACRQINAAKPVWILTEGPAGIGKTSLARFVRTTLQLSSTQFGAGKFEQFHRHTPYGALIGALRTLLQAVMALPEPEQKTWRSILRGPSDAGLAPLAGVLPELNFLLGALPVPMALPPGETQQRLEAAFARFITCFARSDHPLMLFLDDLQWADVGSLRLLRNLGVNGPAGHLILLGTSRDNEVTALHPLAQLLDYLDKQSIPLVRIALGALSAADIEEWLVDACSMSPADAVAPAAWLQQQSEGNPLFVSQLLGTLRERRVLRQDQHGWQWDAARLSTAHLSGNIASFMEARLRELAPEQQILLSCAACLGTEFAVAELACILALSQQQVQNLLARTRDAQLTEQDRDGNWRFAHDRIQQAAYRLLPEDECQQQHLRIGRLLLAATAPDALDAGSFDLATQFNHASRLLHPAERRQVAELNLRAGRRAKASAAFEAALGYFRAGYALLPESAWQSDYAITFELVRESAECAYATGELELAGQLFDDALAHARDRLDRAGIHGIMIMFALNAGRAGDAWKLGGVCLAEFGIALDSDSQVLAAAVDREEPLLRQRLVAEDLPRLANEPVQCSAEQDAVADLLLRLYVAGYQLGKHTYAYIALCTLEYGLQTRHKGALAFGMINFAVTLVSRHGAYVEAEGYAQTALQLAQRLPDAQLRSRIDYIYGSMVSHWTQPVAVGLQALERSCEQALASADKVYIGLSLSFQFRSRIMAGESILTLSDAWEQTAPVIHQIVSVPIVAMYALNRQWLRAWKEQTHAPARLDSDDFNAAAFEVQLQSLPAKSPYHWFGLLQAILAYMHGEPAAAQQWIRHADGNLDAVVGQLAIPEHHFWRGLILHGAGDEQALPNALRKMQDWSASCPANFSQRAYLLQAELQRSQQQVEPAMAAYHAAIDQARGQQHLLLLGLGLERLGDYFVELQLKHQARTYLQEALGAYQAWGAASKVRQLQARYPQYAILPEHAEGAADATALASQAILSALGDIRLERLLRELLPLLAGTAEASRVAAFIVREGELMLEGQHFQEGAVNDYLLPLALRHADDYPARLINDSCDLRKAMAIAAPAAHPQYGAHACWQSHPASVVLCLPILRHGRLLAVLYLERRQGDCFAATRLLIEPLLRQIGAGIENALLYADLEQQIVERTRAEKVAREGERRWRAFLDHAHMAVLTLDLAGSIEYINPYLCELLGYAAEEVIGKNWVQVCLAPQYRSETMHETVLAKLHAEGHFNGLAKLHTRSGQDRLIAWSNSLLRDPDGRPLGSISIGSDMTDQRNAERALLSLNAELEQRVLRRTSDLAAANQELDSFAYSISHDLRAPLRSIDGFSQALAEDYQPVLDAQARNYLQRVRNAARRMGGMIDAMLQMSRHTRGALELGAVDLSAMAHEVIEELRQRSPQRNVRIVIAPDLVAAADARLVRIVLDNLLGNAWKYSAGMDDVDITLQAHRQGDETVYCVSDTGCGFDMARAGKLFHAFQRLHAGEVEGQGIGLATAQRIVHRHGGRIWAESAPGKGARFFFTLVANERAGN